jgi:predicted RNA binding protein YcfA (HicA-like mRNA interferase family)
MIARLRGVRAKELVRALEKVGFHIIRQRGSHLVMHKADADKMLVVPVHPGELPRWLLKKIIKQAGITDDELTSLI